jgi:hypothetical protein
VLMDDLHNELQMVVDPDNDDNSEHDTPLGKDEPDILPLLTKIEIDTPNVTLARDTMCSLERQPLHLEEELGKS